MAYSNEDSGALFKNKEKKSENHPDYRGALNVGGTDYWISSWLKTSKKGEKYMSLSVQLKEPESNDGQLREDFEKGGYDNGPTGDDPFA